MPLTRLSPGLPLLVLVALFAGGRVHRLDAQTAIPQSRSTLTGVLVDPSHASMPGIAVALEDLARRRTYRATTDREGRFELKDLPAGDYEAEVVVPGFAVFREPVLLAGPLIEREIVLAVGAVEETFTVVAGAPRADADGQRRERGEPEPCVARVDEQTQSPVGGQLRPPRMLTRTAPVFPDHLREEEREGVVRLAARIGADGSLADVSVVEASHPDYATAAEDALRGWTWEEPLLNCTPIEVEVRITVRFVPQRP
jgi:TonB family protein